MAKGGGNAIGRGHEHIGNAACLVCSLEIPAKLTSGGKLSLACPWCDAPIYLNKGTKAFDLAMQRVKLNAPAQDPAAASSSSAAAPAGASSSAAPGEEKKPEEVKAPPARSFAGPLFGLRS